MHKNIRTALSETEKKSLYFTGLIHKNSEKRAKILKNRKKITLNQRKKTENFAKSPFFYDLKNFVTFSIFIVTLSIHKSAFLCYNKFAKQKICGFFAPHAHARKFFRAGGGDDNAKRRFADIRRKSFDSQSEKTVQTWGS